MDRKYEILLLIKPELVENELKELITNIESKIGGTIKSKEEWGIKELAYKIDKENKAFYIHYYVDTTSEAIADLKELIAVEKRIIRPFILRHEKEWPTDMKTSKELKFPERKPRQPRNNDLKFSKISELKTVEEIKERKLKTKKEAEQYDK